MKTQRTSQKSKVESRKSKYYRLQSLFPAFRNPYSAFRIPHSKGFTLIELLAVIAIIMLLAGLILAGVNVARDRAKMLRAGRDVAQLKAALGTYYADYSAFPDITEADSILLAESCYITGADLIQTLRGREGHKNPKRIPYMDFHHKTTTFNDPWGNKYRVSMDTDLGSGTAYDGVVVIPGGSGTLRQSVAAWSAGKDGRDGTDDDVKTWRE